MRTCETCKHWDREGKLYRYFAHEAFEPADTCHHQCSKIRLLHDHHGVGEPEALQAFTQDASGYMADFWTAPDFGCTLWKAS